MLQNARQLTSETSDCYVYLSVLRPGEHVILWWRGRPMVASNVTSVQSDVAYQQTHGYGATKCAHRMRGYAV